MFNQNKFSLSLGVAICLIQIPAFAGEHPSEGRVCNPREAYAVIPSVPIGEDPLGCKTTYVASGIDCEELFPSGTPNEMIQPSKLRLGSRVISLSTKQVCRYSCNGQNCDGDAVKLPWQETHISELRIYDQRGEGGKIERKVERRYQHTGRKSCQIEPRECQSGCWVPRPYETGFDWVTLTYLVSDPNLVAERDIGSFKWRSDTSLAIIDDLRHFCSR
jgi:hypothetical protein